MLDPNVVTSIRKFVKTFCVVRLRHLDRFFRDREIGVYKHAIDHLMGDHILHVHAEDIVSHLYPGKLPGALYHYNEILRCLDMLTGTLDSSEVLWYDLADYPLNMRFLTVDDELYDVTYLDSANWVRKYPLLRSAWKKCIPPNEKDPFNHIAVVPSIDVAQKLRELEFNQFIVVDGNGAVLGIYDNE